MAKAKAPPLQGCTIVLSGTWKGNTHDAIKKRVENVGGTVAKAVDEDVTHLITTEADYEKKSAKVKSAQEMPNVQIVNLDWLDDSIMKNKRQSENDYSLEAGTASASAPAAPEPKASKKRTRNGKVKADPDANADGDASDAPTSKKAKTPVDSQLQALASRPNDKTFKDGQKASTKGLTIPVDEGCSLPGQVYIDDDGTIWDATLNQTNAGNNNNKFYRIQVITNGKGGFSVWTRWGRVGDTGQNAILCRNDTFPAARAQFEKKFKDKTALSWDDRQAPAKNKKYAFIEKSYEPDSSEDEKDDDLPGAGSRRSSKASLKAPESKLPEPVQNLMSLIFNLSLFQSVMADMNYDAKKCPLGKLSKSTIEKGYSELKKLAAVINDPDAAADYDLTERGAYENFSNMYYTYIPHNFGRNRPPLINTQEMLKREVDMLESLSDMRIAEELMKDAKKSQDVEPIHPADRQYMGLGMEEMTPLDHKSTEFKELEQYLMKTQGATHGNLKYKLDDIFRIERQGENDRFGKSEYSKIKNGDRKLLWHGSRTTNFGGILSQGLRIAPPEAPVSGYMFGKGVYLADMSSKSANYCYSYQSDGTGLLLLCEAELGKPMLELTSADYNAEDRARKNDCIATWGKGTTAPKAWKDAGCVHPSLQGVTMPDTTDTPGDTNVPNAYLQYNEYICYDVAQIRLRYLFRVKM